LSVVKKPGLICVIRGSMSAPVETTFAWEPLTPRGVAAFAHASILRLLLVQFLVALLAAASVGWFLYDGCFPTIAAALHNLPATGEIRSGQLDLPDDSPQLLAQGRLLAFDVDINHSGQISSTADVQIEFGRRTIRVFSLFGFADFPYPTDQVILFDGPDLEPLWGAWRAEILFIAVAATVLILLLSWAVLATVYFFPVWLLGFYANRDLNFRASWKLSGAALMPGALLMVAAILCYGYGFLNLVSFIFVFAAHLVLGWIYLFASQLFVQRSLPRPKKNPFANKK
jgi:hypothetical protein